MDFVKPTLRTPRVQDVAHLLATQRICERFTDGPRPRSSSLSGTCENCRGSRRREPRQKNRSKLFPRHALSMSPCLYISMSHELDTCQERDRPPWPFP